MSPYPRSNAAKRRVGRRRRQEVSSSPAPAPPVAPTLLAATFDDVASRLSLTFDRAIDIAAFDATAVTVDDGAITGTLWQGLSGLLTAPASVRIDLEPYDPSQSAGTVLNASANNGIVAVDDGAQWAGVTDVELPFP